MFKHWLNAHVSEPRSHVHVGAVWTPFSIDMQISRECNRHLNLVNTTRAFRMRKDNASHYMTEVKTPHLLDHQMRWNYPINWAYSLRPNLPLKEQDGFEPIHCRIYNMENISQTCLHYCSKDPEKLATYSSPSIDSTRSFAYYKSNGFPSEQMSVPSLAYSIIISTK